MIDRQDFVLLEDFYNNKALLQIAGDKTQVIKVLIDMVEERENWELEDMKRRLKEYKVDFVVAGITNIRLSKDEIRIRELW